MKNPTNAIYYLRKREGLSQTELAKITHLTANDICRLENGNQGASIGKVVALAQHFSVSVDALIRNNFNQILPALTNEVTTTRKLRERIKKRQEACDRIGDLGEAWVLEQEKNRLAGTIFAHAVNQNFADDDEAHFDLISIRFDENGNWYFVCIEIKATNGSADEPFYMTAKELEMARYCISNGIRYEIHRVFHVENKKKIGCIIYSANDLLTEFDFIADSYIARKKAG